VLTALRLLPLRRPGPTTRKSFNGRSIPASRSTSSRYNRLADAHHGVSDETWAQIRQHYDDDQIAALVCLVALINAANRLAVIVHQQGVPTSRAVRRRAQLIDGRIPDVTTTRMRTCVSH
jgi:hypothetical protein